VGVLPLVHDVHDAQLVDRREEKIGRVDALVLELDEDAPPRLTAVLLGAPVRARRIGRVAVWLHRALRAIGRVRGSGVSRISFDLVRRIGENIQVDVDGDSLESLGGEQWLAEHIVCRIPGAARKRMHVEASST